MTQIKEKIHYRRTALGIIKNERGGLLIALNPRVNSTDSKNVDKDTYKFPQGGIEINESPKQALIRELKEELGLNVSQYNLTELNDYVSYWFINSDKADYEIRLYAFLIEINNLDIKKLNVDKEEVAELKWIKPKKIEYLNLGIRNQAYLSIMRRFKLI